MQRPGIRDLLVVGLIEGAIGWLAAATIGAFVTDQTIRDIAIPAMWALVILAGAAYLIARTLRATQAASGTSTSVPPDADARAELEAIRRNERTSSVRAQLMGIARTRAPELVESWMRGDADILAAVRTVDELERTARTLVEEVAPDRLDWFDAVPPTGDLRGIASSRDAAYYLQVKADRLMQIMSGLGWDSAY